MTKQEFENLTGAPCEQYVFDHAEEIYLNAGALTKEQVCVEIKKHPWILDSQIVAELTRNSQELNRLAADRLAKIEKLKAALLDACWIADDNTAWRGAAELVGRATCIIYKLGKDGSCLNKEDVEYIQENLR